MGSASAIASGSSASNFYVDVAIVAQPPSHNLGFATPQAMVPSGLGPPKPPPGHQAQSEFEYWITSWPITGQYTAAWWLDAAARRYAFTNGGVAWGYHEVMEF